MSTTQFIHIVFKLAAFVSNFFQKCSKRSKALGIIQKQGPYEVKLKNLMKHQIKGHSSESANQILSETSQIHKSEEDMNIQVR